MVPRRPLRRRPGRPGRPAAMAKRRLNQAHRLMAAGEYLRAANLFEDLAQGAARMRIPRAPFLFLQTGRAYLFGGQESKGFTMLRRGLKMLADAARWRELYRIGHRTMDELGEKGFDSQKARLEAWLEEVLPEKSDQVAQIKAKQTPERPVLPTTCPQCGGIVDSKAVTWMDDLTAECLYCGSPIRAET